MNTKKQTPEPTTVVRLRADDHALLKEIAAREDRQLMGVLHRALAFYDARSAALYAYRHKADDSTLEAAAERLSAGPKAPAPAAHAITDLIAAAKRWE